MVMMLKYSVDVANVFHFSLLWKAVHPGLEVQLDKGQLI